MVIDKTANDGPSGGGGDGSADSNRSTLEFKSLACLDMKSMSQSELYSLSLETSNDLNIPSPEYVVVPNIESDYPPTGSITATTTPTTTTSPSRIFAFSNQRGPRRRISSSINEDGDPQLTENRLILNSLEKLIAEGEGNDSNPQRGTAVAVDNEGGVQKKRRKRKSKVAEESEEEFGVIKVNGEEIDLKFLADVADGAFQAELNKMTEGMVTEEEFLGLLKGLEGRWGSSRKRRKYVDATVFLKALPINWKILLSLRPRVRRPSLYCRRFVSPSDDHFNSCEDVALYLKSQFATSNTNPPEKKEEEEAMIQIESDCQVDLGSVCQVPTSYPPASKVDLLGTNDMHKVPIYNLIECYICRSPFTSIGGLEYHLQMSHRTNILDMNTDTLTRKKRSVPHGLLLVREPKYQPPIIENSVMQNTDVNKDTLVNLNEVNNIPMNGEGSSSAPESNSEGKANLKARCVWCLVEFVHEPVDAETLVTSSRFLCSKCKNGVSWRFESALNKFTQHADK